MTRRLLPRKYIYWISLVIFAWNFFASEKSNIQNIETKNQTLGVSSDSSTHLSTVKNSDNLHLVVKVVDGDTIKIEDGAKTQTVRLIGIDTPEVVDPRKPVQCFGVEASEKAKDLLLGKSVFLEEDETQGDKDRYGRLLRYVYLEDGSSFNKLMISGGYGHQYTYDKPYKYMEEYKVAEASAKEAKSGLWGEGVCL